MGRIGDESCDGDLKHTWKLKNANLKKFDKQVR